MQTPRFAPHLPLSLGHCVDERPWLFGTECAEAQTLSETLPAVTVSLISHGAPRYGAKFVDRTAATGRANDAVVVGHEPRLLEVQQPGEQFALRQIPERTEEDN